MSCKKLIKIIGLHLFTPSTTAERSVAAALRIWFTPRGFLYFLFSFLIDFLQSSEPIGPKFGHDAWIGPEGDNKDKVFHRDSFCSFLIKNRKPP